MAWGGIRIVVAVLIALLAAPAGAREPAGLDAALAALAREGRFSGAVVIRDAGGVRFARGYGWADPFARRAFTPETPVDSASLAKPVTAAAVLWLAREGRIDLDAPVRRYLPDYPHPRTRVRHLLAHSAGLDESLLATTIGRTNAQLLAEMGRAQLKPRTMPGSAFEYCSLCYGALALLVERTSGMPLVDFAQARLVLPPGVTVRPRRLADWSGRAIGYRLGPDGTPQRADSYDNEAFYGSANLSLSAAQLADWGAAWWQADLAPILDQASEPARIDGRRSGLSLGNWYCAPDRTRCHYLGHHEGFHHMLYWNRERRVSLAMVSNNSLARVLHQRLQRALVAFAEGREADARRELAVPLADVPPVPGRYRLGTGEAVAIVAEDALPSVRRRGIAYPAYPVGAGLRYVPELDLYLAGAGESRLAWLTLYEDETGTAESGR